MSPSLPHLHRMLGRDSDIRIHQWGPVHLVGTARLGRQQMRFGPQREGQTLFVLL
jgi:hypothetical protein